MTAISPEPLTVTCSDGHSLGATLYRPSVLKAAVMIAPATGIKRIFYHSFAEHLASQCYGVITYDNRGIGDSLQGPISRSKASLIDWGQLDQTAILEKLKALFPQTTYHLIGHSAGGQLVGLMENALDLSSMFTVASSSGQLRNMEYPFRFTANFYMNFFIPISNLLFGHTKSQWVGMGEPLPRYAAAQWSKWCNGAGYVEVDLDTTIKEHYYREITMPSKWLYATDDTIANRKNVEDMVRVFPNLPAEVMALNPTELGVSDIGHMKFFSKKRNQLWVYALDWLSTHA